MTLPGFNAETSLYNTRARYCLTKAFVAAMASRSSKFLSQSVHLGAVGRAIPTPAGIARGIVGVVHCFRPSVATIGLSLVIRRRALPLIAQCLKTIV
jgi:hypothetical protein